MLPAMARPQGGTSFLERTVMVGSWVCVDARTAREVNCSYRLLHGTNRSSDRLYGLGGSFVARSGEAWLGRDEGCNGAELWRYHGGSDSFTRQPESWRREHSSMTVLRFHPAMIL